MSGIFDKIKEKKAALDRTAEDRKIKDIEGQIYKRCDDFKKALEKAAKKMGLSVSYIDLWGADARQRNPGMIVARFTDKEGYPITLVQTHAIYQGTPWGASLDKRIVYCGASIWGTMVPVSIPFTLLFKSVPKGFMKGKERLFLPLTSMPFNEKELLTDPRLQEPILAALNSDKKLVETIDDNTWEGTVISLTHKSTMSVGWQDIGGRCLIVPAQGDTCIFLRTFGYGGDNTLFNFEKYLGMLSTIRRHVLAHPHPEKTSGQIPATLFNTMYAICKAESPKPSPDTVF